MSGRDPAVGNLNQHYPDVAGRVIGTMSTCTE